MAILIAGAEQTAEHAHRKLLSDELDEVELIVLESRFDHVDRELADRLFVGFDAAAGESLAHEPPVAGVIGRIHLHHRAASFGLLFVHFFEANSVGGGKGVDISTHRERVVVAKDRPEP